MAVADQAGRVYCSNPFGDLVEHERATGDRTGIRLDSQLGSIGDLAVAGDGRELVAFGGPGDLPLEAGRDWAGD
jgi:hypothetical protein